jgi:hypothetical protein
MLLMFGLATAMVGLVVCAKLFSETEISAVARMCLIVFIGMFLSMTNVGTI